MSKNGNSNGVTSGKQKAAAMKAARQWRNGRKQEERAAKGRKKRREGIKAA